jgi:hypothetical protein
MSARENKGSGHKELPPCMIRVDKEGRWFHKGAPIIHRELLALFYKSLDVDEQGRYVISLKEQVCLLDVEDTPYVIVRTDFVPGSAHGGEDRFVLRLIDNSEETLAPETLWIGAEHVLYCKVRDQKRKARFSRPSYYQLGQYFQEEPQTGRYFLSLNNTTYYIEKDPLK